VLDGAGSVVDRHVYDAFGNLSTTLGDAPKRGFTSHLYQASTGLHLTRTRAYSADLGRWLSRDPIEEAAGLNLYAYVDNDPANVVDPLGLAPAPFPPPPANVPGGPWKWAPNPQNGRGGTYIGRDGSSASWEPQGKNGGHWDVDRGGGHRDRYSNRGKPLTKGEAHSPTKKARQPIDPNTNNQLRKAKKRARAAAAAVARFLRGCKIIPIITINPCVINPCLCPMEPDDPRRFWCGGVTIEG
jgi:RHS repeat-associated protein